MSDEPIGAISRKESHQRQKNLDMWQKYYDQIAADLKDLTQDPEKWAGGIVVLSSHQFAQMAREAGQARTKLLTDYLVKDLKEAHAPSDLQKAICIIGQFGLALLGGGLSAVPAFTGVVGAAAKAWQGAASTAQALSGASQTVGSFCQSYQQGLIGELNAATKLCEQRMQEDTGLQQTQARQSQTASEGENRKEQSRHETMKGFTQ